MEVGWSTQVGGPIAFITAARASMMFGTVVRRARTRYVGTPGVHVGLGTQAHTVVTNVCASIVTHEKDCVKFFQATSPGICLEQYCAVGAVCADAGAEAANMMAATATGVANHADASFRKRELM